MQQKVLCIIGGSGYTGQNIAKFALIQGLEVFAVSRKGKPQNANKLPSQINWIKGDAMKPEDFKEVIERSDYFVNTIGTLIDTSITKNRKPGEQGTYEHMNLECAKQIGSYLNKYQNKKLVYLSASSSPPFIPRYLQTKELAEDYLLNLENVKTTVLKPGFIYSWQERKWSVPLKLVLDPWSKLFPKVRDTLVQKNTYLHDFTQNFIVDESISLNNVVIATLMSLCNDKYAGRRLTNQDMAAMENEFQIQGGIFPNN